ncbi:MAG: transglycosylase SLT domain-containing protein [Steroidobacteraceae bacterium]
MATRSAASPPIVNISRLAALGLIVAQLVCSTAQALRDEGVAPDAAAPAPATDAPAPAAPGADSASRFARPPGLDDDVRFWIRVYTEVTTDQGLLHDSWNLGLVYEVIRFDPELSPSARERRVDEAKAHYAALLRRFAAGATSDLNRHERRILHAFGEKPSPRDFLEAVDRIRFQLGQADRFHEGLIRAAAWERHISRTLARSGVPEEIAVLPHVESSFNPAAYSRVGAAGLWQFMPTTARRYMRVDNLVDERLDPYRATEAAANLMLYNYRLVGTWPLAVTAYNHGPGGLRRAQEELGTSDIAVIVKRFQGATFGFASRNFYVAFLAALDVDRNAENYFGPIARFPDAASVTVDLPDYVPVETAAKAFKVDMGALRVLNPALLPPIWNGSRFVPRGYALRVPGAPSAADIAAALERIPANQRYLAQRGDDTHRLRRGETVETLAAKSGVGLARLLAVNGWASAPELQRGQLLRMPMPPTRADKGMPNTVLAAAQAPPAKVSLEGPQVARAVTPQKEPVAERQTEAAALLPAATPTSNTDATDYSVGADGKVVVQADETLGHFADWSATAPEDLRRLNHLNKNSSLSLGHKLRLSLARVDAAQFEAARRSYHRELQETYFASHRIAATQEYTVKHGESLWIIAHQHSDLPLWLVAQYNPDVDFGEMRPGATITLPQVEPINRQ